MIEGKGIRVTDAHADQPGLVLRVVEVAPGRTYRVEVTGGKDGEPGNGEGLMRVLIEEEEIRLEPYEALPLKR